MWCVEEGDGDIQNHVYALGLFHSGHFDSSVRKSTGVTNNINYDF